MLHSSVSLRGSDRGELLPNPLVMLDVLYSYEHSNLASKLSKEFKVGRSLSYVHGFVSLVYFEGRAAAAQNIFCTTPISVERQTVPMLIPIIGEGPNNAVRQIK